MNNSPRERYVQAWTRIAELVTTVPETTWDNPSPCTGWSARQLAGHLVDGEGQVRALLEDREPRTPVTDPDALTQLGADPATALGDAAERAQAALTEVDTKAVITTPHGALPLDQFLTMALIEPVVHGWDLATATGLPLVIDEQAAETLLAGVKQLGTQLAATGMYAPAVPVDQDAPPIEQLLAALGRPVGANTATTTVLRVERSDP